MTDLADGDGAGTVSVELLDASPAPGLAGSLCCQTLPGGFTTGDFSGRRLGTSHAKVEGFAWMGQSLRRAY